MAFVSNERLSCPDVVVGEIATSKPINNDICLVNSSEIIMKMLARRGQSYRRGDNCMMCKKRTNNVRATSNAEMKK